MTLAFSDSSQCDLLVKMGSCRSLPKLWKREWQAAVVLGDENVIEIYGDAVGESIQSRVSSVLVASFPPGDDNKTRSIKEDLEDCMLSQGLGRRTCIIAVGGGVSLDMAGYVAATYMRGIPYVSLPTSLLAMVDASIGGKTGVNTEAGKNLVGAIHQPSAVLVDPAFLQTLPEEEWCNGLAEILKTAVVADAPLFDWIETHVEELTRPGSIPDYPLEACVARKSNIVEKDPREGGIRAILNFGHSLGHALEKATKHGMSHGRAVAMGMEVEARIARKVCGFPAASFKRLAGLLKALGFEDRSELTFDELLPYLKVDKKNRGDEIRMALPQQVGEMAGHEQGYTLPISLEQVKKAWETRP